MPTNRVPFPSGGIRQPCITYRANDPRMADVEALRLLPENGGLGRLYLEALMIGAAAILARQPPGRTAILARESPPVVQTVAAQADRSEERPPVQSIELAPTGEFLLSPSAVSVPTPVQSIELAVSPAPEPVRVELVSPPEQVPPSFESPRLRPLAEGQPAGGSGVSAAAKAALARFGAD